MRKVALWSGVAWLVIFAGMGIWGLRQRNAYHKDLAIYRLNVNFENAFKQLTRASGQRVTFQTGLCLLNSATGNIQSVCVPYTVVFKTLTPTMIKNYLNKEEPYNCAGSFKSEALGIALFERFEGNDPNALIGLPLIELVNFLDNEGFSILD